MPHKKVQLTAGLSFVYSLILLVLAVAADRFVGLAYIAALFSPIGHELVVYSAGTQKMSAMHCSRCQDAECEFSMS